MAVLKLPRFVRRNPDRPSILARARALRATTAKILHLPLKARQPVRPPASDPFLDVNLVEAARNHSIVLDIMRTADRPSDAELDELGNRLSALERVLICTPARSAAGLRAKAGVLRSLAASDSYRGPNGDDLDQLGWSIMQDVERLPGAVELAEPPALQEHPDAELLELGRQFEAVLARMAAASDDDESDRLCADELEPLESAIKAAEPSTLDGLAVQARLFTDMGGDRIAHADMSSVVAKSVLRLASRAARTVVVCPVRQEPPASGAQYRARATFGDAEAELFRLNDEYETWHEVYRAASDAEDAAKDAAEAEKARIAVVQGLRRLKRAFRLAAGIVPTTPLGWGLRARLIAADLNDWWDEDVSEAEAACRTLIDQLISSAGVARMRIRDFTPEETLAHIRGHRR